MQTFSSQQHFLDFKTHMVRPILLNHYFKALLLKKKFPLNRFFSLLQRIAGVGICKLHFKIFKIMHSL